MCFRVGSEGACVPVLCVRVCVPLCSVCSSVFCVFPGVVCVFPRVVCVCVPLYCVASCVVCMMRWGDPVGDVHGGGKDRAVSRLPADGISRSRSAPLPSASSLLPVPPARLPARPQFVGSERMAAVRVAERRSGAVRPAPSPGTPHADWMGSLPRSLCALPLANLAVPGKMPLGRGRGVAPGISISLECVLTVMYPPPVLCMHHAPTCTLVTVRYIVFTGIPVRCAVSAYNKRTCLYSVQYISMGPSCFMTYTYMYQ